MGDEQLTPAEAAVLVLISRGITKPEVIADTMRISVDEVKRLIESLKAKGLVEEEEKKILFLRRKRLRLTSKGFDALSEALELLKKIAERARHAYEAMRAHRLSTEQAGDAVEGREYNVYAPFSAEELMILPVLVTLGILPAVMLAEAGLAAMLEEQNIDSDAPG